MTDPATRLRFVQTIRRLRDEPQALQLLRVFEGLVERSTRSDLHSDAATAELRALEQLPDWSWPTLMQWAFEAPAPAGHSECYDAGGLQVLREFQLLGMLAKAAEQSIGLRELRTTHRITEAMARTWLRLRGEQLLSEALSNPGAEGFEPDDGGMADDGANGTES